MPQEINIVHCYKCEHYQAQIAKQGKQWRCVVCGEKQSLKRIFFTGSGKDCRSQVQKLNEMRLSAQEVEVEEIDEFDECDFDNDDADVRTNSGSKPNQQARTSKWAKYLDENDDANADSDKHVNA